MKLFSVAVFLISMSPHVSFGQDVVSREECLEDMNFVISSIRDNHPNIFHKTSEEKFDSLVAGTSESIATRLTALECYVALKKIVASVQDGHTQIFDPGPLGIENLRYPFRLEQFKDGVFVIVIRRDMGKYLGARVIRVNGVPIGEALATTTSITSMDNAFGRIRPSVQDLTFAKLLFGLGITETDQEITLDLITSDGREDSLTVEPIVDDSLINWSNRLNSPPMPGDYVNASTLLGDKTPLHIRYLGENIRFYWFEHLGKERAIYVQYNQVANQPDHFETWAEFTDRLWAYIDLHELDIDKLILDLRYNDGGVARMFMPFLNKVIRSEKFSEIGNLFVLSSNRTFSASVIIMTEFAVHTDAIFVGTPPASPFNSFSDMTYIGTTPNIGIGVLVSARQNDNSWSDYRDYFPPDIPTPLSSIDYFTGNDPALEAIFSDIDSKTLGQIAIEDGAETAYDRLPALKDSYADVDWYVPLDAGILEQSLYRQGQKLERRNDEIQACEIFKLNTLISPQSTDAMENYSNCIGQ